MTSRQHRAWVARGSPWRLARPLLMLQDRLRAYGYTVYDIGDDSHLDAQPPEHHAPYSEVNWPILVGRPMPDVVTAIDVMPPRAGSGLPSLQALGRQICDDRLAGVQEARWIVDMNWGPVDDRHAVRDTWMPAHTRKPSSDTGHIHLSVRSDAINFTTGDSYDPVARVRGQHIQAVEVEMPFVAKDDTNQYYVCDLITSRPVEPEAVQDVLYLAKQLGYGHGPVGPEWTDGGWTRVGWAEESFGRLPAPTAVKVDAAELAAALLADPAFASTLAQAAFQGAQRAETE